MGKTNCNVKIWNYLPNKMTIDIDDNDKYDWVKGPLDELHEKDIDMVTTKKDEHGKIEEKPGSLSCTLISKDDRTRCWFQMNNKYGDDHIGMTHIEMKSNEKKNQAKRESCTQYFDQIGVKVTYEINTPKTGEYSLEITYKTI